MLDVSVSRGEVYAAWRRVVAEARPFVSVVGGVSLEAVVPLLEDTLGGLRGARGPVSSERAAIDRERWVLVDAPTASQAHVSVGWDASTLTDDAHAASVLVADILAGGIRSRASRRLREQDGYTYRVDGTYDATAESGGTFLDFYVGHDRLLDAIAATIDVVDGLGTEPVSEDEREVAAYGQWAAADRIDGTLLGYQLWAEQHEGLAPGALHREQVLSAAVPLGVVQDLAARWGSAPRLWVITGDRRVIEPMFEAAGRALSVLMGPCQAVYARPCPRSRR